MYSSSNIRTGNEWPVVSPFEWFQHESVGGIQLSIGISHENDLIVFGLFGFREPRLSLGTGRGPTRSDGKG